LGTVTLADDQEWVALPPHHICKRPEDPGPQLDAEAVRVAQSTSRAQYLHPDRAVRVPRLPRASIENRVVPAGNILAVICADPSQGKLYCRVTTTRRLRVFARGCVCRRPAARKRGADAVHAVSTGAACLDGAFVRQRC
jgi:hypothetical protein